jgi:hypothetical protein
MNCAICGKDNQPGTRFCVHCGAALAVMPTGSGSGLATGAATAARPAMSGNPAISTGPTVPITPRSGAAPLDPGPASRGAGPAPAIPAYDAAPKKAGLIVVLIGLAALVVALGYAGFKFFGGPVDVKDTLSKFDAPPPARPEPSPAPGAAAPAASTSSPPQADATRPGEEKSAPAKTDDMSAVGAAADAAKMDAGVDKAGAGKSAPSSAVSPKLPATPSTTAPAPAAPVAAARPAAPATTAPAATGAVTDRWTRFAEELRLCQGESFLNRVLCDQRVRVRYCDGYWGKVPQCPAGVANPDR